MSRRWAVVRVGLFTFSCVLLVVGQGLRAEPTTAAPRIAELLEAGWQLPAPDAAAVQQFYEASLQADSEDARADLALALVHLKARRYREASHVLDRAVTRDPGNLASWRAYTWLLILLRDRESAIVQMEQLATSLGEGKGTAAPESDQMESARWLGRLSGFLAGPAGNSSAAELLAEREDRIRGRLLESQREAHDAGRDDVLSRYQEIQAEIEKLRADAEAIRDEARRTGREAIARERTDLVAQSDVLGEQSRSAQSRYDAELADLNAQLAPLQARYAELERLAIPYQRRIRDIAIRIADRERRAAETEDPIEKDRLLREADRWRFEIDRDRRDLRIIEREGAVVSAQAARVQTQAAAAARQLQAQQNSLAAQARKIEARRKALDREEASLDDPAKTPAAALAKRNSLSSLTIYIKYPLEDERARLLAEVQAAE